MKVFERIAELFRDNRHSCSKCKGKNTTYKHNLARGWNDYCDQVYGDWGWFCTDCFNIDWETSLDEHLKTLPSWCKPYKEIK